MCFCNSHNHIISVIGEDNYNELKSTEEISVVLKNKESPTLFPSVSQKNAILHKIKNMNPTIGVELLLLFNGKGKGARSSDQLLLAMYNVLRSVSTLKGITYYSASRKKNHVLYKEAHIIESPETKKRINDPVFYSIPRQSEVYAYFKDASLGDYTCFITYHHYDNSFLMSMENISAINYLFFPIVQPHSLLSYIIIIPSDAEIVFYGLSCLRAGTFPGSEEGKIDSLYNRIKAIYQWFQDNYPADE